MFRSYPEARRHSYTICALLCRSPNQHDQSSAVSRAANSVHVYDTKASCISVLSLSRSSASISTLKHIVRACVPSRRIFFSFFDSQICFRALFSIKVGSNSKSTHNQSTKRGVGSGKKRKKKPFVCTYDKCVAHRLVI